MLKTWRSGVAVTLTTVAMTAACGGNAQDPAADQRRAQYKRGGSQQVSLTGCVQAAPGNNQYVLRNVRMAPAAAQPSDAESGVVGTITEGSFVRLQIEDAEEKLQPHIGKMVSVTGRISDAGADTLGTSGEVYGPKDPEPRTDASRAAENEHYSRSIRREAGAIGQQSLANGTAPQLAVERITSKGEACPAK